MRYRNRVISLFILVSGCLGYQNIMARTVYQWTDETGNINFSDVPPAEAVVIETHEFNIKQTGNNNVDLEDYSIINQVERMAKWRREIADERLAKRELKPLLQAHTSPRAIIMPRININKIAHIADPIIVHNICHIIDLM